MTEQSLKEISNFIDEAKIYYLATVDGDQPKNRPLGGHHIYDGRLMFTIGDEITVKGNFHILSDEWGVVLKNSVVL
jgi:uncharacterized pyridoxamine 5'-phosphate oxidase family protein